MIGRTGSFGAGSQTAFLAETKYSFVNIEYQIMNAVDRILDMFRTTTNVLSDSCGSVVVARLEGESLERIGGSHLMRRKNKDYQE